MDNLRKPDWIRTRLTSTSNFSNVHQTIQQHQLHTICESGKCPNLSECWNRGTATFMILGEICTRSCKFCNTATGRPLPPDPAESQAIAEAVYSLKLKHVVITSVDRDDLHDKGASFWAKTIRAIQVKNPNTTIEVLIPDFDGQHDLLDKIIQEKPNVISHNMETVRRLTPLIRSKARYETSLAVLNYVASQGIITKSGIMIGLGETEEEVLDLMEDVLKTGCSILTIGQYLQPSKKNIPVSAYISPQQFEKYKEIGLQKGFKYVESAPFVRSSYFAEKHIL